MGPEEAPAGFCTRPGPAAATAQTGAMAARGHPLADRPGATLEPKGIPKNLGQRGGIPLDVFGRSWIMCNVRTDEVAQTPTTKGVR